VRTPHCLDSGVTTPVVRLNPEMARSVARLAKSSRIVTLKVNFLRLLASIGFEKKAD
jgi:hypothetical protein